MKHPFTLTVTEGLSDIWKLRQKAQRDAERHHERLRQAAKDNLQDIITSEDIISTDSSGKKIKIPIKQLEQWHFRHGKNKKNNGAGHSGQDVNPGDIIHAEPEEEVSNKAGDKKGDLVYEEFALEEIVQMMLDDFNLPWLQEKNQKTEIETDSVLYTDINKKGLMSNLDIRRTLKENIKRNAVLTGKATVGNFDQEDLRYKTYDINKEYHSNASVCLIMDRSGSMTNDKKYIAKSFFFWLVQFIKKKYINVELTFIAHDTEAYFCTEKDFFSMAENGGTKCSSGFIAALSHIKEKYPIEHWNNYVFAISDGDNYDADNQLCIKVVNELLNHVNAIGYGEIMFDDMRNFMSEISEREISTLQTDFQQQIKSSKFLSSSINKKSDVYECLKKFFNLDGIT